MNTLYNGLIRYLSTYLLNEFIRSGLRFKGQKQNKANNSILTISTTDLSIKIIYFRPVDTTPPTIESCPSYILQKVELGTANTPVFWEEPSASDISGGCSLNQTHTSGDLFPLGSHDVIYTFTDSSRNAALCSFKVFVVESKANIIFQIRYIFPLI